MVSNSGPSEVPSASSNLRCKPLVPSLPCTAPAPSAMDGERMEVQSCPGSGLVRDSVLQPQGDSRILPALGMSQSDGRGDPYFTGVPSEMGRKDRRVGLILIQEEISLSQP